jgi:signal transduction histidine kinase
VSPRRPRPPSGKRAREAAYRRTLQEYLARGGEDALRGAYDLGRGAMADGCSLLEMVALHHAALRRSLRGASSPERSLDRAREIFAECLSPYEMALRGFGDAISALRRLNETLESEIQRIAHDVHDEAGQLMVAARLALAEVTRNAPPALRQRLGKVGAILDEAEGELRRISHELRPLVLDDLGLVPALQLLAEGVSGKRLKVWVESAIDARPDQRVETAVYRVVQEALANAARHSRARKVTVRLSREGPRLCCLVQDDGVGFDPGAVLARPGRRGLGLVGMRERLHALGGTLQIRSRPGLGTEVLASIPAEA